MGNRRISIHAPHAGSDGTGALGDSPGDISIHAPHAGSDWACLISIGGAPSISIHAPHAGSDGVHLAVIALPQDFNPRSPCGERRASGSGKSASLRFQSTLPMRGATNRSVLMHFMADISIHAPHAGSDHGPMGPLCIKSHFNPRSPCGERRSCHPFRPAKQ